MVDDEDVEVLLVSPFDDDVLEREANGVELLVADERELLVGVLEEGVLVALEGDVKVDDVEVQEEVVEVLFVDVLVVPVLDDDALGGRR